MRGAAGDCLPALVTLPRDVVVRIAGLSADQLIVELDPLPTNVPLVIRRGIYAARPVRLWSPMCRTICALPMIRSSTTCCPNSDGKKGIRRDRIPRGA